MGVKRNNKVETMLSKYKREGKYYIPVSDYETEESVREEVSSLICQSERNKYGRMHWVLTQDLEGRYVVVCLETVDECKSIIDCTIDEFNTSEQYQSMLDLHGGLLSQTGVTEQGRVAYSLRIVDDRVVVNTFPFNGDYLDRKSVV